MISQALFSSKDKSRKLKCRLLQFLFGALRVKMCTVDSRLSRNRRGPQKQFEISVLRHIRFVVLRKKQFEQPIFTNDYVI